MLPLQQAYEVKTAVLEYIKATFHFKDASVGKAFYSFIEDERNGLFKGPYVSLKTPFVKAKDDEEIPLDIKPDFKPHKHQVDAFKRLTTSKSNQVHRNRCHLFGTTKTSTRTKLRLPST